MLCARASFRASTGAMSYPEPIHQPGLELLCLSLSLQRPRAALGGGHDHASPLASDLSRGASALALPLPLPVHGAVSAAAARGRARQCRGSAAAAGGFEGWSFVAVWGFLFCFVVSQVH